MSLLRSIVIGGLKTPNNLFLAPLAGIGDNAYRILGRRFGAGLTFSEMVSAEGLVRNNAKTRELLRITEAERPVGIQLFGSDPGVMGDAAGICGGYGPDLIDINGGCSVRKVLRTGAGAALLADPDRLFRIVRACVVSSPVPVSVKIRLGLSEDRINAVENGRAIEEAGASLVTLHGRTAAAGYGGRARWEYIARVKQTVSIPVCGNGDILAPADAVRMIEESRCDAVMVGRGAIGNPWLLTDIIQSMRAHPAPCLQTAPQPSVRVSQAIEHLELARGFKGERRALNEMKRHVHRYVRGIPYAAPVRERLFRMASIEEMKDALLSLLDEDQGVRSCT
jgi:tRNA-dihydrouridine synthase B